MTILTDAEKARQIADELQARTTAQGGAFTDWFEELYASANGDAACIPWGDEKPHPGLVAWVETQTQTQTQMAGAGIKAIDVGCGLGDNAAFLADCGFDVTAIDLSQSAVDWAASRFKDKDIRFRQADLLALPPDLAGQFELVHETYTLQALPSDLRARAFEAIAALVAPGGRLLVISRSRPEEEEPDGPPWPLAKSELGRFVSLGLREISVHSFIEEKQDGRRIPHYRIEYQKPC